MEFRPKNPSDPRFDGLAFISDTAYDAIRNGILEKLNVVVSAIAAGKSEEEVYQEWRDACAADVAEATRVSRDFEEIPEPTFSVAEACKAVWAKSVTIERTAPAPDGEEINVEFSLDGNLKHHLQVVLESVLQNTSRPIRAYVLCRDHDKSDFDRVSALFPTVSFVWLPTDDVDYGDVIGMIKHITVATMDRLLLPELLPDVERIIHHDLDAICAGDLAELFDTDLNGHPIAARTSPQPEFRSGFRTIIAASERLKKSPERARELVLRTHARHVYDFNGFNAGVMVLDLNRMRADDFCRHFLPYAERFGMHDQEILNVYAGSDRTELDNSWNMLPRVELLENPKIVHWAGYQKPWNDEYVQGQDYWIAAERKLAERQSAFAQG
jgi:lipopolysaccharide biosynthesis glycosyltransferase